MTDTNVELYKPNELIGAIDQIEVSRTAKHLLNFFLQYAQQQIKFHNHHGFEFEVDVTHINGLADIHTHDYPRLKKSLQTLMQPVVLRDDPDNYDVLVPITRITIDVPKGLYKYELQPQVIKLLEQTDYFTKLQLSQFNPLQSKHSITIFEWLKRWETAQNIPPIAIEKLRNMTGTVKKATYDKFSQFSRGVLDPAIAEINEKTPYQVSYEPIKTRAITKHKVTEIKFHFTKKEIKIETKNKPDDPVNMPSGYEKLRKVCGRYMTLKFYYEATYIYTPETLEQFADDCAEKYKPNRTKFFEWLNERCGMNQKGYLKQQVILNEKLFRDVFAITEKKYSMMIRTEDGELMPAGFPEIIINVKEEYVAEAMQLYGKLPYNEYKHYLSGIWKRFEQEFNVNKDNVFE
jgi:hypothetical protein